MQCFEKKESENIKERRKIYAARDFFDKFDHSLFQRRPTQMRPRAAFSKNRLMKGQTFQKFQ